VSALGHFIETAGIATTGISLVREHTLRMAPPRALWVPFELGRPFGAPGDAAFQHRVLGAALALLDAPSGPVLADFPDDAPGNAASSDTTESWSCPVSFPPPPVDPNDLGAALAAEIGQLAPWYAQALRARGGRTTLGVSEFDIEAAAVYAAEFLSVPLLNAPSLNVPSLNVPNVPPPSDPGAARRLKSALEDLKTFYSEAAVARPGIASTDAADWLWRETALGRLMFALAQTLRSHNDPALRYLAEQSLVPRAQSDWWKANGA
jgi:hypothetical protein